MKPSRKRAKQRKLNQEDTANKKLAPELITNVNASTYLEGTVAMIGDTKMEAMARPKLTALDRKAI